MPGSIVPSTYSFKIASISSHFIISRSSRSEPASGKKLHAPQKDLMKVVVRSYQAPFRVAQGARQQLAQLQPGTEQAYFDIRLCLLYTSDAADDEDSVDLGG